MRKTGNVLGSLHCLNTLSDFGFDTNVAGKAHVDFSVLLDVL